MFQFALPDTVLDGVDRLIISSRIADSILYKSILSFKLSMNIVGLALLLYEYIKRSKMQSVTHPNINVILNCIRAFSVLFLMGYTVTNSYDLYRFSKPVDYESERMNKAFVFIALRMVTTIATVGTLIALVMLALERIISTVEVIEYEDAKKPGLCLAILVFFTASASVLSFCLLYTDIDFDAYQVLSSAANSRNRQGYTLFLIVLLIFEFIVLCLCVVIKLIKDTVLRLCVNEAIFLQSWAAHAFAICSLYRMGEIPCTRLYALRNSSEVVATESQNQFLDRQKAINLQTIHFASPTKMYKLPLPVKKEYYRRLEEDKPFRRDNLLSSKASPNVTLIVDGNKIPAHRSILSENEYFKTMFSSAFKEAKSNEVVLKETNVEAFRIVLKYIYADSPKYIDFPFTSKELFEILTCARLYMVDKLVAKTISLIKLRVSATTILNNALVHSVEELISYSTDVIQKSAFNIVEKKIFNVLSPKAVKHLLKQPLNTDESTILEALVGWVRLNPDHSDLFPNLLKYIDLYLIDEEQREILFEPTPLIDRCFVQNFLNRQQQKASKAQKIVNKNVINGPKDVRVVEGRKYDSDITPSYLQNEIIIDLKKQYLLNCLKFKFGDDSISYTVSVSTDMHNWACVIDYSEYHCFNQQVLYFDECVVRYILIERVEGDGDFVIDANIEAIFSTEPMDIEAAQCNAVCKSHMFHSSSLGKIIEGLKRAQL
uniref:BTB domain-containing protein n=1 Tax=Panagrellus redivivus TaxID=6233 RepID=A0A7E4ZQQ7_PANRE